MIKQWPLSYNFIPPGLYIIKKANEVKISPPFLTSLTRKKLVTNQKLSEALTHDFANKLWKMMKAQHRLKKVCKSLLMHNFYTSHFKYILNSNLLNHLSHFFIILSLNFL